MFNNISTVAMWLSLYWYHSMMIHLCCLKLLFLNISNTHFLKTLIVVLFKVEIHFNSDPFDYAFRFSRQKTAYLMIHFKHLKNYKIVFTFYYRPEFPTFKRYFGIFSALNGEIY